MKAYNYRVLLTPESEGGFTVTVPSDSGCITYGGTVDECIINVKEAIELYMESLEADVGETKRRTTLLENIVVTENPELDQLFGDRVLFPEKLAQANEFLVKHPLPEHLKKPKS